MLTAPPGYSHGHSSISAETGIQIHSRPGPIRTIGPGRSRSARLGKDLLRPPLQDAVAVLRCPEEVVLDGLHMLEVHAVLEDHRRKRGLLVGLKLERAEVLCDGLDVGGQCPVDELLGVGHMGGPLDQAQPADLVTGSVRRRHRLHRETLLGIHDRIVQENDADGHLASAGQAVRQPSRTWCTGRCSCEASAR